ncbi:hypothetical protein LINPERPRIM_LOCUS15737 [Linum perenne]
MFELMGRVLPRCAVPSLENWIVI